MIVPATNIVWTNTDTLVSQLADPTRLGATMGAAGSFKELGDLIGPITIGLLAQGLGLSVGLAVCGGFRLAALVLVRAPESPRDEPPLGPRTSSPVPVEAPSPRSLDNHTAP